MIDRTHGPRATFALVLVTTLLLAGCLSLPGPSGSVEPIVEIRDHAFTPSPLTVKAGTIVSFRNQDEVTHAPEFDGSALNTPAGATSQRSFGTLGDHEYTCKIHGSSMRGTIRVTAD